MTIRSRMQELLEVRWSLAPPKGKFTRDSGTYVPSKYPHEAPHQTSEREAVAGAKAHIADLLHKGAVQDIYVKKDPKNPEKHELISRLTLHKGKTPKGAEPGETRLAFSRAQAASAEYDPRSRQALLQRISLFKHPDIKAARAALHAAIRAKKSRIADPEEKKYRQAKRSGEVYPPRPDPTLKGAPWGW